MRENVTRALAFVDGLDYERFRGNLVVVYAVTRALEIISEASRRLPDVAGAGNVYRHDYEDVRERDVWTTLQKHLPPLLAVVEEELRALGELS
jgi:uncharacterized protein with HEPN domain